MALPLIDSFAAVPLLVVLIYVPHACKAAAILSGGKKYDLRAPRVSTALASDSSPLGEYVSRAQGAHLNGFEQFPIFVAGVVLSTLAGVPVHIQNLAATAHVISRALYIAVYMSNTTLGLASVRSALWFVQLLSSGYLMYAAVLARK